MMLLFYDGWTWWKVILMLDDVELFNDDYYDQCYGDDDWYDIFDDDCIDNDDDND